VDKFLLKIRKTSVRTSQETRYISGEKSKWLIFFSETIGNHTKHKNTGKICGENSELIMLKQVVHLEPKSYKG
jgi:hypothetical protein